jgi:hypothetical protein
MKAIITESKLIKVIHTYLNYSFEGFDECYYDWAEFNCGMGVCCDPYAVGFVLPDNQYYDYLFKLVNGEYYDDDGDYPERIKAELPEPCHNPPNINDEEFDTIILSEDIYEPLERLFGDMDVWKDPLLTIINKTFNINARNILYLYL